MGYKIQRMLDGGNYADVGSTGADVDNFSDLGLTPNTNYTYRVYAYNGAGNSLQYSNEINVFTSFNTLNNPTITIGTQVWTTRNLDVITYRNGDPIPHVRDSAQWESLSTGAWCWYNNDSATYGATYGRLYNWYAVNDPRGLAPSGWHVPTASEWNRLVKYIDAAADTVNSVTESVIAGAALKSVIGWEFPNTGANNTTCFSALPGGFRSSSLGFIGLGNRGTWWSTSQYDITRSKAMFLYSVSGQSILWYDNKKVGRSVRVIKD